MISVQKCFAATNRVLVWNCLLPLKDQEHKMKWNMDTFWCRYIPVHTFGFVSFTKCISEQWSWTTQQRMIDDLKQIENQKNNCVRCRSQLFTALVSIYLSGSIRICLTIWCYSNQKKRLRPKHYIRTKIVVLWTGHYNVLWTSFVHVLPPLTHHL